MINTGKSGFQRLGFIENNATYAAQLRTLSRSYVDYAELNATLDAQWEARAEKYRCFNAALKPVSVSEPMAFLAIDTGYQTPEGEAIYGGFAHEGGPAPLESDGWQGVTIATMPGLLRAWRATHCGFTGYTFLPGNDFSGLAYALYKLTGVERTAAAAAELVQDSFDAASAQHAVAVYTPANRSAISYFRLLCKSLSGQPLYLEMEKNGRPGAQPWFGALVMTESALLELIRGFHCFHRGLLHFSTKQSMLAFLQDLAEDAMEEAWTASSPDAEPYGILASYVEHTLARLVTEDAEAARGAPKKVEEIDGRVYFNSGLLNRLFRQIILVGSREVWTEKLPLLGKRSFYLICDLRHFSEQDREITDVYDGVTYKVPPIASYFTDYSDVVFNARLPVNLNDYHIFEDGVERGRLPKYTAEWKTVKGDADRRALFLARIARDFSSALARARLMAERNYKLAVPQYWQEDGEIQFLLPIYLGEREENGRPECALALKLVKTGRAPYYRGATILTLDMAYNNSRLLAKPDVFWLNET